MNMEDKALEKLLKQKREIEAQIKALKNQAIITDNCKAKIDIEHYYAKADRHYVAVKIHVDGFSGEKGRDVWRSVINGNSREEVISKIPDIIKSLQELYDIAKKED